MTKLSKKNQKKKNPRPPKITNPQANQSCVWAKLKGQNPRNGREMNGETLMLSCRMKQGEEGKPKQNRNEKRKWYLAKGKKSGVFKRRGIMWYTRRACEGEGPCNLKRVVP